MNEKIIRTSAAFGLIIGGILGLAGSFAPTDSLRLLAWNFDGAGLTIACILLSIYYYRKGISITASGFLLFTIGECFILASNSIHIEEHGLRFAIGAGLWSISTGMISSQKTFPVFFRITGLMVTILFAITAILIFTNHPVNPLTKPLPFFAYPFFVITIVGWAISILLPVTPLKKVRHPMTFVQEPR
jgi:hypothetical protein